jgi:hypothetical protein
VLQTHYDRYLQPPGVNPNPPLTDTVCCGLDSDGKPWIIETDRTCTVTHYTERGLHTVGSGAGFAQLASALLSHFHLSEQPLSYGKVVAWRTLNAVIETSAALVGHPIQMWAVTSGGVEQINKDELREIELFVGGWQLTELDTLSQLMDSDEVVPEAPLPPEL